MFHDLYKLVEHEVDVTLFKGGGPTSAREKVPVFLPRNGRVLTTVPLHELFGRSPIHAECLTYALGLLPHLWRGDFDVLHCIDPPLTAPATPEAILRAVVAVQGGARAGDGDAR